MGILSWIRNAFARPALGPEELARRLGVDLERLRGFEPRYRTFKIPKKSGGSRTISAPDAETKALQRTILRRLLDRLAAHPAATGFERGASIVTNAKAHAGRGVVVRIDLKDFFGSTSADRVRAYFQRIGWNAEAAEILTRLVTDGGHLPQGAPTSPRLSNLVNRKLDARLAGLAAAQRATYTRYADDITFSFARADARAVGLVASARKVIADEGYALSPRKKPCVRRRWARQLVTGLVVNAGVDLPRETRRWLRAVAHRVATNRVATISQEQLAGWTSLVSMIVTQRKSER